MKTSISKVVIGLTSAVLIFVSLLLLSTQHASAKSGSWTFHATLKPQVWQSFPLGPANSGVVYLADINPLTKSVDGANIQAEIKPVYNGSRWNDTLMVRLAGPFPKQQVQITIYRLSGLETRLDLIDTLNPGVWQGYVIGAAADNPRAYLADIDPLEPAASGATFERIYIHPEAPWEGRFLDILRVQTAAWLSDQVEVRMRVYLAPELPLVSDLHVTLKKTDLWAGYLIGPSSLKQAYLVRAISLDSDMLPSDLNQYVIQAEYNGKTWNDVLRIQAGNQDAEWEQVEYNFKIYACDRKNCQE